MANNPRLNSRATGVGLVAFAILAAAAMWAWLARPPRLGADEKVFDAVDALFTAVRARDERLLGDCEQILQNYETDGSLPAPAMRYLRDIIETARSGKWRPAAETLYDLMKAQRPHKPRY